MVEELHNAIETLDISEEPKTEFNDNVDDLEKAKKEMFSSVSNDALCCAICNVKVTSMKILQRHVEGKKHKTRAGRMGKTFNCDLCNIVANSEIQLMIHLKSSKHRSRISRNEYREFIKLASPSFGLWLLLFCAFCIFVNMLLLLIFYS